MRMRSVHSRRAAAIHRSQIAFARAAQDRAGCRQGGAGMFAEYAEAQIMERNRRGRARRARAGSVTVRCRAGGPVRGGLGGAFAVSCGGSCGAGRAGRRSGVGVRRWSRECQEDSAVTVQRILPGFTYVLTVSVGLPARLANFYLMVRVPGGVSA